jgi:hypothetical protein
MTMLPESGSGAMPLAPADTDWLRNTLGVISVTEVVWRLQVAASFILFS